MKMRLMGFFAFALLSISILSYGLTGAVYAQEAPVLPLSVGSDLPSYSSGDTIIISGSIKTLSEYPQAVTIQIFTSDISLVFVAQVMPDADGDYSTTVKAGGAMRTSGDYEIRVQYGAQKMTSTFVFTGGVIPPTTCGADETRVDGVCKPNAPIIPEPCGADETRVDGVCKPNAPIPEPCGADETRVDGVCKPNAPIQLTCAADETLVDGVCKLNEQKDPTCGKGTVLKDGICVVEDTKTPSGCLIATATYGTELAPQVQLLREIRDNTLFSTTSGTTFMNGFNTLYYSFAPTVSDWERESPLFKEAVKTFITPMISTLSIMSLAENGSESEVLGLGISVIMLNLGMYIAAPALIGIKSYKHFKSRK